MQNLVYVSVKQDISFGYIVPGTRNTEYLKLHAGTINKVDAMLWAKLKSKCANGTSIVQRYIDSGLIDETSVPVTRPTIARAEKPLAQQLAEESVAAVEKQASTPKPKSSKGVE